MTPHYSDHSVTLYHGDCLDILRDLPDCSVDAVVTDPPYGLNFMGREWDKFAGYVERNGSSRALGDDGGRHDEGYRNMRGREHEFQQWCELWATESLRVLKPGGHMLAFGGTRTFHRLACAVEDAGFEIRDSIAWLYGSGFPKSLDVSKAIDKKLCIEAGTHTNDPDHTCGREAVGERVRPDGSTRIASIGGAAGVSLAGSVDGTLNTNGAMASITAPATDAARQWQGWGTALKPAHEPVIVARKPAGQGAILAEIGSHLDRLEDEWQAQAAAPKTPTGKAAGSSAATGTPSSESTATTSSSTVTSWRRCWVELCELTSTSTTGTTSETTTALRTLSFWISKLTAPSMHLAEMSPPGLTSLASVVDSLFASVVYGLRATLALSAVESATASTPPEHQDAAGANPRFEPVVVARKPLVGTVAGNVTAWGTGALNVDGCRIGTEGGTSRGANGSNAGKARNTLHGGNFGIEKIDAGRWPANVILDESQADALDQQSGEQRDGVAGGPARGFQTEYVGGESRSPGLPTVGYGGSGGASRYFYTAKADTSERIRVDGTAHPTVKPLSLMRWLVRLVTPPGGTVLEPFAGSGTTVEACILEGLHCIAIEREPDYLPLIVQRVNRQRDPIAYTKAAGEDLGLFGLDGEIA